jgi:NAD(P)-dependent dehydrogenase (short-subunit alcohol dehydrogenase family)
MARVLITGCSTGIGRATAVELAGRGHEVVATARRPETLQDLEVAERHALDVDDDASVQAAVAAAGPVDVLVNNAGWETAGPVEKSDLDEVRAMFETNLLGAARMIQAVLPAMRERGRGTIVNVSSVAGVVAGPLNGFYAASKHALEAMSESLHYEVGHFGIRVVIIEPGAFATAFGDNARRHGEDAPPYDELRRQWDAAAGVLSGGEAPGPEPVARAIADAIEADDPPLRVPVGDDAQLVVAVRAANDDATFEATMRETLGLTW